MPYGTYFLIEISTKNKNVPEVVEETIKTLKKMAANKFTIEDLKACKRSHMVGHFQDGEPSRRVVMNIYLHILLNNI